jgi:hypothetical protein
MKVSAMTDPRPLTRRNLRSGPLVASTALAVVVGLSGLALATVAAVSIARFGVRVGGRDRCGGGSDWDCLLR